MTQQSKQETARARFNFGLVHQANKGLASTRRVRPDDDKADVAGKDAQDSTKSDAVEFNFGTSSTSSSKKASSKKQDEASASANDKAVEENAQESQPDEKSASSNEDKTNKADASIATDLESQPKEEQAFTGLMAADAQRQIRKEVQITANAAKVLNRIFAAMTLEPGSGKEADAKIRSELLNALVFNSVKLTENICDALMKDGTEPPSYLRSILLDSCTQFIARQYLKDASQIEEKSDEMLTLAKAVFDYEIDAFDQKTMDSLDEAGTFTRANTVEVSQSRITETIVRQSWWLSKTVNSFNLNYYDPNAEKLDEVNKFTYSKPSLEVVKDLTSIALGIAKENKIDIEQLDLYTSWVQNSINRAFELVEAEYKFITDRVLRATFRDGNDLHTEVDLGLLGDKYDDILDKIKQRATASFKTVEANALEVMSINSFKHYLPKKETVVKKEDKQEQAQEKLVESASGNNINDSVKSVEQNNDGKKTVVQNAVKNAPRFSFGAK